MNRIVASAQISLMDYNDAIVTGSIPTNPEKDMLWLNTSVNPHIMKQYTGSEWIIVGELDPEYTEKLEVITGNITNLELTLGNMADDGKLDYGDRQEIVDKLLPIIGYLPVNTSVTLKTVVQLDADKKGSFYQLRQAAQNAGIVTSSTAYTGLASAWNALRAYLGGLDPKPWDLSTVNQDAVTQVDKGTFRTHWLNYYNAEYTLATATTQILHSAISTINTTTLPAMRDSALSSAEKTAIKQSLIILSSEKTAMDGEITGLKANPKFENQTPLNEAKSAYDTSYTGVTTAINAVLAVPTGTLIPSTLILGVEDAVSSYSAKLSLLKKAMQDSQTAIAKKVSDDASRELSDSLEGYVDKITYGQDIEEIQNQVDGAIMTWFGDNEPTLLTAPAKEWNTTALKDVHLGDLYYDNKSGYAYRFGKDGARYLWIRIVDADVVAALAAAQNAQDTADGKRRAFYNQPTPPYDAGDLWVQGEKGELKRAVVTRDKNGLYHENDWVKAVKYTDDTAIENLEIGGRNLLLDSHFDGGNVNGWNSIYGTHVVEEGIYKKTFTSLSSAARLERDFTDLEVGEYTFTIFLKTPINLEWGAFIGTESVSETQTASPDVFKRYSITFTVPTAGDVKVRAYVRNIPVESVIEIDWEKLEKGNKATDWTPAPEDVEKSIGDSLTAAENYANTIKTGLETQIDGKVETYNQTADPATSWTAEEKTKHKGDLWYHPTNKITKLWSGSSWTTLEDAVATGAQQLAQAKSRVFTSTPTTPYEIGDLWVQGTSGDLMRCVTARASGSYAEAHWVKATKYTDDTKANAAATAASNAQTAANNAQADAKKANDSVSDIISDNKMTPDEKVILQREWLNIQYERNEILSQAERYVIDNASYRSVYDTLSGYLAPFFTNLTTTQNVNGETLRSNFQRYYEQRQAILDAISVAAQQKVLDLQTQVDAGPFADKTSVLSGTEIFTDKADNSVVHVDIDGKSYQHAGSGKNLFNNFNSEGDFFSQSIFFSTGTISESSLNVEFKNNEIIIPPATSSIRRFLRSYGLGNLKPNTTYVFSFKFNITSDVNRIYAFFGTSVYPQLANEEKRTSLSFTTDIFGNNTVNAADKTNFQIISETSTSASTALRNTVPLIISELQLEEGSVATTYEPPTLTPDYPVEIHSLNDFDVVSSVGRRNYILNSQTSKGTRMSLFGTLLSLNQSDWKIDGDHYIVEALSASETYHRFLTPVTKSEYGEWTFSGEIFVPATTTGEPMVRSQIAVGNANGWVNTGGSGEFAIPHKKEEWVPFKHTFNIIEDTYQIHVGLKFRNGSQLVGDKFYYRNWKFEKTEGTPYTPAPEDITEGSNHPLIDKTNILLSEPLRSVGDVKDRLFRDSDGLWKVERNVEDMLLKDLSISTTAPFGGSNSYHFGGSVALIVDSGNKLGRHIYSGFKSSFLRDAGSNNNYNNRTNSHTEFVGTVARINGETHRVFIRVPESTIGATEGDNTSTLVSKFKGWVTENNVSLQYQLANPTIETLPQSYQDKLNNIATYAENNYLYTIVDKTNILPEYVRDNLKPNLRATFKSQTWYQNYKRGNDLRHFVEVKGLDRAIRFGMLVDYQSFAMPTANWLYFCKIQTNTNDFREELVDEDGSIFDYTTQREIKVPKQALDLRGVAEGTTGYLAFDTRNQLVWFIHYQRNYTNTTNPKTGIIEKIPSSEYWIKWNPGKTGHNTQLVLDESVYIVGEIER